MYFVFLEVYQLILALVMKAILIFSNACFYHSGYRVYWNHLFKQCRNLQFKWRKFRSCEDRQSPVIIYDIPRSIKNVWIKSSLNPTLIKGSVSQGCCIRAKEQANGNIECYHARANQANKNELHGRRRQMGDTWQIMQRKICVENHAF